MVRCTAGSFPTTYGNKQNPGLTKEQRKGGPTIRTQQRTYTDRPTRHRDAMQQLRELSAYEGVAVRLSAQIRGHERHFPKGVFLCLQRCQARCGRVLGAPPSSRGRVSGFGRFSVTKRDLEGEDFFVLKPKRDLEGDVSSYLWPTIARARRTAARRHGLLPSSARSSTPASAQASLWLCTWPSWTRPCYHPPLRRRHVAFKAPAAACSRFESCAS